MRQQVEITILSKILQIQKFKEYRDEDDFAVRLSRIFLDSTDEEEFLNKAQGIATTFFKANKIKRQEYLKKVYKLLLKIRLPLHTEFPRELHIDDIDSFGKVRNIQCSTGAYISLLEKDVKEVLKKVIGEHKEQKDWGGEQCDLFTTKFIIGGKRISTALALKGRGKKGILRISDCGKNGDQILRLFKEPAKLYVLQYVGPISSQVYELMNTCAYKNSAGGTKEIYYCIIDGSDTQRIFAAYKK